LRKASQRLNLNLGEVAQNMIDTVDLPAAAGGDRGTGRTGRADGFGRTGSFNPGPGRHRSRAE
jgi:hypothetical protein